ncbi:MAG: hypothetical protein J5654_04795 [Victivallales bacterium]|nr:hypothetical protein [Victivallales bacterium]
MPSPSKPTYQVVRRSRWSTIWRWLISDPWRKLIALLLAFGCWLVLNYTLPSSDNHRWETIPNIPITIDPTTIPGGSQLYFVPQSLVPREVSLAVAVDAWSMGHLSVRDFRLRINPTHLEFTNDGLRTQPLECTYTLLPTDLDKPNGVTLRGFIPASVTFQWDRKIAKQVPVHLNLVNQLPDNLSCHAQPTPPLHVIGPAYLVNQITVVESEPILINHSEPGTLSFDHIQLQLPSQFSLLELERQFITATVEVTDNQRIQTRILKDVRLNYVTNPDSALVLQNTTRLPRSLNIYVSGPAGVLEQLDAFQLMALCDLTAFSMPGPQDVPVQVMNLPADVRVTRMLPHSPIRVVLGAPPAP